MQFASIILNENLRKLGHQSEIVTKLDQNDKSSIWIIYNASLAWCVPEKFICYQTEQKGTHWFNERYFERLNKCIAVWEYSEYNLSQYQHLNSNISIISPGVKYQPSVKKDIDFLFYAALSDRRKKAIESMPDVMVVTNILGQKIRDLLSRTKTVINIHYYDNSPLETFRINEALSHNCNVVSEHSLFGDNLYKDYVRFGNINELKQLRKLEPLHKKDLSELDNFEQIKQAIQKLT